MPSTLWKIFFFRPSWPSSLFACLVSSEVQRERRLLWVDSLISSIMITNKHLQWLFVVWLLYVIGLVIFIGIIFGGRAPVEDRFKWTTKSSGDVNNLTNCNQSTNVTNATNSTTSPSHSTNLTFSTEQITWVCFHYLRESEICGFVKFTLKKVHYKIQNETKISIKSFII